MPDVNLMHKVLAALIACVLTTACGGALPTDPTTVPALSRTRFLAFGDSITAGEVTAPLGGLGPSSFSRPMLVVPTASYPSRLLTLLRERYVVQAAAVSVLNEGKPGEAILDGGARFPDTLAASQAEVVLLMEGVNGLSANGPDLPTEVLRGMVRLATSRGARAFVGSMIPTIEGRQRSQSPATLMAYNVKLQQMARDEGAVYVDLYTALLPEVSSIIGVDGLHPTEAGYKRIADVFFSAIQANLEVR